MGQPKKQRRKFVTPAHMYKGREGEKELVQAYGLKNMRELWKAKSEVSRIRSLARKLLAFPDEKTEKDLLSRMTKLGILKKESKLEDVLKISVENLLDRRLQTLVYKKSITTSIKQAMQDIVHGHIAVKGEKMTAPGHLCTLDEESTIDFYAGSPLADPDHPIRNVEKPKASTEEAASREVEAGEVKPPSERPKEEAAKEEKPEKEAAKEADKAEEKKEKPKEAEKKDTPEAEKEAAKEGVEKKSG
jgi:small subunit ribosomal protein S4